MSSPVNRKLLTVTGVGDWIPLNRWAKDDLSIVTTANGTVTYDVEFTLDQVNRPNVTVTPRPIENGTGLTADANLNVTETPMEAIRVNITDGAGSVDFHVMQSGY